jgi:hypothetical protein
MLSKKKILAAITRFPDLFDVLAVVIIGGVIPHNALAVKARALPGATIKKLFQQVHVIVHPGIETRFVPL